MSDSVIYQGLHEEVVLLNLTTQNYYGLDDVGACMWKLLLECADLDAVVDRLTSVYDTDGATLRHDLHELVAKLLTLGMLIPLPD